MTSPFWLAALISRKRRFLDSKYSRSFWGRNKLSIISIRFTAKKMFGMMLVQFYLLMVLNQFIIARTFDFQINFIVSWYVSFFSDMLTKYKMLLGFTMFTVYSKFILVVFMMLMMFVLSVVFFFFFFHFYLFLFVKLFKFVFEEFQTTVSLMKHFVANVIHFFLYCKCFFCIFGATLKI